MTSKELTSALLLTSMFAVTSGCLQQSALTQDYCTIQPGQPNQARVTSANTLCTPSVTSDLVATGHSLLDITANLAKARNQMSDGGSIMRDVDDVQKAGKGRTMLGSVENMTGGSQQPCGQTHHNDLSRIASPRTLFSPWASPTRQGFSYPALDSRRPASRNSPTTRPCRPGRFKSRSSPVQGVWSAAIVRRSKRWQCRITPLDVVVSGRSRDGTSFFPYRGIAEQRPTRHAEILLLESLAETLMVDQDGRHDDLQATVRLAHLSSPEVILYTVNRVLEFEESIERITAALQEFSADEPMSLEETPPGPTFEPTLQSRATETAET